MPGGPSGGDRDGRVGRRLGDRPRWRERWTCCGLRFARLCPGPPQAPGAPALPSARPHAAARLAPGWGGGSPRVLCRQGCDRESVSPAPGGERAQRVDGEGKATRLCVCVWGAWPLPRGCHRHRGSSRRRPWGHGRSAWAEGKGPSSHIGLPVLGTGSEDQRGRRVRYAGALCWGPVLGGRLGPGSQRGAGPAGSQRPRLRRHVASLSFFSPRAPLCGPHVPPTPVWCSSACFFCGAGGSPRATGLLNRPTAVVGTWPWERGATWT